MGHCFTIKALEDIAPKPFNFTRQMSYLIWILLVYLIIYFHIYTYNHECMLRMWFKGITLYIMHFILYIYGYFFLESVYNFFFCIHNAKRTQFFKNVESLIQDGALKEELNNLYLYNTPWSAHDAWTFTKLVNTLYCMVA